MAMAGAAVADEFKLTPSIAVRQEYSDNIFFDSSRAKDSFVTRVIPGLELIERTERLDLRLAGAVTPYFYWDESDLNSIDQEYSGKAVYALTSRLSAGADAAVRVDHQPDRDIRTTGFTYTDNRRIQQRYGGNLGYQFTELTSVDLSYRYSREDWRNAEDEGLEDYDSHAVTLGLSRDLGAAKGITVGLVNAGYAHYAYDTSKTDYWFGTIGVRHRLTEVFSVTADGGARYTRSEFDAQRLAIVPPGFLAIVTEEERDSGWGAVGHAGLEYGGEKTRAGIDASHDIAPLSGSTGVVQRSALTFNGGHLLTEKLRLGLFAGGFLNRSDENEFSGRKIDEASFTVNPSLRWELYRDITLEAGYAFTYVDNREDDTAASRNLAYIQLAYGLPLFE
jgi:opacity protein-like surface antigen